MGNKRITPSNISELKENEIFVFGSNTGGIHGAGAAKTAYEKFGACIGLGEGQVGNSYALPTCEYTKNNGITPFKDVEDLVEPVRRFLRHAHRNRQYTYYVTRVGCGIAGFKDEEVAPLFRPALDYENVYLPIEWIEILDKQK